MEQVHPDSVLGRLSRLPDPRRRQGQRYPLAVLLGMLLLAALNGESSLRGMWLWAKARWSGLAPALGFAKPERFPAYGTLWRLLAAIESEPLGEALEKNLWAFRGLSLDGKVLRGSRRDGGEGLLALKVVTAYAQELGQVLGETLTPDGNELQAALTLLSQLPVAGRVVTQDAGLLCPESAKAIQARGGDFLGVVKGNRPQLKEAVDLWVAEQVISP